MRNAAGDTPATARAARSTLYPLPYAFCSPAKIRAAEEGGLRTAQLVTGVLGIFIVLVPVERVIEDVSGDALVIGLVADNMFVIIPLPDIARIQISPGAAGNRAFECPNDRRQGTDRRFAEFFNLLG